MNPQFQLVSATNAMRRTMRSPKHPFSIRHQPYAITPFFFAPILAGESLKNLMVQNRIITDPVKGRITGWWAETYFFYVKHRDLAIRDSIVQMHLEANANLDAHKTAASAIHYHNGGVNFVKLALEKVVEYYFRDHEEALNPSITLDGLPIAKIAHDDWQESLKLASEIPTGGVTEHELPGDNPVIPPGVPAGFENHFSQWEAMRAMSLTDKSFEDYLASFGVKAPSEIVEDQDQPELLRYVRNFSFPANTIDPTNGAATSAVSWSIAERADKVRMFKEPGFLIGVQVVRPKVYLGSVKGTLTSYLDNAFNWLPAILQDQPYTGLKEFTKDGGPLDRAVDWGGNYWLDIADLFVSGEQFVNDFANTDNIVAASAADPRQRYVRSAANIEALFAVAANKFIRSDGMVSLNIASTVRDTTG